MHQISKVGMTKGKKEGWKEEKKKGKGGGKIMPGKKDKDYAKKGGKDRERLCPHIYLSSYSSAW